jgi:NADH-quinone oxidoreductase subunit A
VRPQKIGGHACFALKKKELPHPARSVPDFFAVAPQPGVPSGFCYSDILMPEGYLPVFIYLLCAILFPIALLMVAKVLRPSLPTVTKSEAYECGIKAASGSRGRYTVRFYIIAILFVIFDVETIFLYPWAVRYQKLGWFGVAEVAVFLLILIVGYIWAYKKGALEWV